MPLLTSDDLDRIGQASVCIRRRNVILCGTLRRHTRPRARSAIFVLPSRRVFAVLDDTHLALYSSLADWVQYTRPELVVPLDNIDAVYRVPNTTATVQVEFSGRVARLTAPHASQAATWHTLLSIVAPRPPRRNVLDDAALLDAIKLPGAHADREIAIADVLASASGPGSHDLAIVALWQACSCGTGLSCWCGTCRSGRQRFLAHVAVAGRRHGVADSVLEALLEILMGKSERPRPTDRRHLMHDGRVHCPAAWGPLLHLLQAAQPALRSRLLHDINALLIGNTFNCRTLVDQRGWQSYIYSAVVADRGPAAGVADEIVALSANVFIVTSYDALLHGGDFIGVVGQTLLTLQVWGALDATSLHLAQTFLTSLAMRLTKALRTYPADTQAAPWVQTVLLSQVVRDFVLASRRWGSHGLQLPRQVSLPRSVTRAIRQWVRTIRHRQHFQAASPFPLKRYKGVHLDRDGACTDRRVITQSLDMFTAMRDVLTDDDSDVDAQRDPFITKDVASIIEFLSRTAEAIADPNDRIGDLARLHLSLYHRT